MRKSIEVQGVIEEMSGDELFGTDVNERWHLRCRLNTDRKHENTLVCKYFALVAHAARENHDSGVR